MFTAPPKPREEEPKVTSRAISRDESYRPAWADEFNRETTEAEKLRIIQEKAAAEAARLAAIKRAEDLAAQEAAKEAPAPLLLEAETEKSRPLFDWVSPKRSA